VKKIFMYMLAILALVAMTGCENGTNEATTAQVEESALPGGGTNNVYVITTKKSDEDSKTLRNDAGAVIEEAGYVVKARYHEGSEETQTELIQKAIDKKAAAIVCAYTGTEQIEASIQAAKEAGIPVFLVGESSTKTQDAVSCIEPGEDAGKTIGEQVVDYIQ
jgi:erythritol transport system substrate-binding protein